METTKEWTPVGWEERLAWQDSDDLKRSLGMIAEDLRRMGLDVEPDAPGGFWFGLSLQHLASCAFAAGLDVGLKKATGTIETDAAR